MSKKEKAFIKIEKREKKASCYKRNKQNYTRIQSNFENINGTIRFQKYFSMLQKFEGLIIYMYKSFIRIAIQIKKIKIERIK